MSQRRWLAHANALSCGLLPAATRPAPGRAQAMRRRCWQLCVLCVSVAKFAAPAAPRVATICRGQSASRRRATVHRASARRTFLREVFGAGPRRWQGRPRRHRRLGSARRARAAGSIRITKLETILVKPRWLFLKVHTDAGIVGLGEPVTEGRALTCADGGEGDRAVPGRARTPRRVVHHWQAIYRHAFYRGGPILTSALSRHRPGAVGHQGQGARRAGVRAARRPDARPRPRLRARAHHRRGQGSRRRRASPRSRPARI